MLFHLLALFIVVPLMELVLMRWVSDSMILLVLVTGLSGPHRHGDRVSMRGNRFISDILRSVSHRFCAIGCSEVQRQMSNSARRSDGDHDRLPGEHAAALL